MHGACSDQLHPVVTGFVRCPACRVPPACFSPQSSAAGPSEPSQSVWTGASAHRETAGFPPTCPSWGHHFPEMECDSSANGTAVPGAGGQGKDVYREGFTGWAWHWATRQSWLGYLTQVFYYYLSWSPRDHKKKTGKQSRDFSDSWEDMWVRRGWL